MARNIKHLVSKKKIRYNENGFDLDLTYITKQIIAMGVPAEKFERFFRNDIVDVSNFLEQKHPDRYKVYNLCYQRSYDTSKFRDRVETYPMHDHNPPPIHIIPFFCKSVHDWLKQGPDYVAAVHCKAGKGRTGVMICCYLLYENYCKTKSLTLTATDVINRYGHMRTSNAKGVTIPSQKRYIHYYEHMLLNNLTLRETVLLLKSATIDGAPAELCTGTNVMFRCKRLMKHHPQEEKLQTHLVGESSTCQPVAGARSLVIRPQHSLTVQGDVKICFYKKYAGKKLFKAWLHTMFVLNQPAGTEGAANKLQQRQMTSAATPAHNDTDIYITLTKSELDIAHKDTSHRDFPENITVTFQFGLVTEGSESQKLASATNASANNSCHSSSCSSSSSDTSNCDMTDDSSRCYSSSSVQLHDSPQCKRSSLSSNCHQQEALLHMQLAAEAAVNADASDSVLSTRL